MSSHPEPRHEQALNRYWNELTRNATGQVSTRGALEPATAEAVELLQQLGTAPAPPSSRERVRRRVRRQLALHQGSATEAPPRPSTALPIADTPAGPNGRTPLAFPAPPGRARASAPQGWAMPHLATAALVALVLIGSFFAFGIGRSGRQDDAPVFLPALSGTPTTPEENEASIAEFLWVANGEPDAPLGLSAGAGVDPQGNVWVTDGLNGRFVIFSPAGAVLETWGTRGDAEGQFDFRCRGEGYGGVAFDAAGNIYVADAGNGRIQKFAPDRTFLASWPSEGAVEVDSQFLDPGRGNRVSTGRPRRCPVAVAIDPQGRVVVSDQDGGEILVFDAGGRPLVTATRERMRPEGVAVDGDGNIWVAGTVANRVLKFSPDGALLAEWSSGDDGDAIFQIPMGIAVDEHGRVFVSDQGNRVQVFAPDGALLGGWGTFGFEPEQFNDPVALAADGAAHIYVLEHMGRVQKFRVLPPGVAAVSASDGAPATADAVVRETLFDADVDGLPSGWGEIHLFRWTLEPSEQALVFPPVTGAEFFMVEAGTLTMVQDGMERRLAAGDVYVPADPGQEIAFRLSGAEQAALLKGTVVTSLEMATRGDPFHQQDEFLLESRSTTLPGGSGRLIAERLTLPPGSALAPYESGAWDWIEFAAGTLALTLDGEEMPDGWTAGEEQTIGPDALWKMQIAAGTRMSMRNAGAEPLILYRMTLMPDVAGTSALETPGP
jgi:DNA-binding beta-propeller fold protein YncE